MLNFFKNILLFSLGFLPRIKPVFFIVLLLFYSFKINSQINLIKNGSFEDHNSCDCTFNNNVHSWKIGYDSPDYFNVCTSQYCGIPANDCGMIFPKEGNAIVGEGIWLNNSNSREFMYTEVDSLLEGHKYCLSFYIAHAQSSGFICNNIEALFTDEIISYNLNEFFNYQPQIRNERDFDAFGIWYKVEGNFIANGFEKYLYIGNFTPFNQSNCDYINGNDSMIFGNGDYIFLDDVILTDCSEYIIPNIFSPNNDSVNDTIDFTHYSINKVEIINRWGNVVFESSDFLKIWNGTDKFGRELNDGVYYYKILINNELKTGFIHLVR